MSDAVKIHQTVSDGNAAAESDADPVPAAERGIEIAEEDSSEIEHHDISNERDVTKSPENQTGVQTNSGQDEVMDETCQDQAQPNSKRDEDECSIDKVQPEAENAESEISDAEHRALVQANSDVQGVGEVQSCSNSSEKDETQSETAQVENEPIDGNETPFEVDQIENQSTSGEHDDALIEVDQVGDHFTSSEQDLVQNELGQNQANNDKTKSGTKQEKLPNDGRAAAAKTGMRKIKSTLTSGRTGKTGVLQGNRTPACIGRKKKLAIKNCRKIDKTCSDFSVGKSASSQAQIKSILAKPKSQTKNAEKGNLNVLEEADKVQPQLTVEKEPLTVETNANDINEPKNEAADMSNKDELQATTDQTWPPESTEAPASGRLPESDGFLPSKEGKPVTMFWCDICKVVCTSALNLQMHFLGFKHKKIEAALKWNVNTAEEGTKDEVSIPTETRTLEYHLSKMKINKAVLGLDYVIEYRNDQKTNPQFVCKLCYCKSELTWFFPHLLGAKHMTNYLEKHHPGALKYEGEKLKPSEWKEFVFKKALEIEKLDGRGKVTVVHEKTDTKSNEKTAVKRIAETSAVEPEHKVQKSEDTSNEEIKESEEWSGMYLYPDGLPINFPVDSKPYTRPVRARQEATAPQGAVSAVDDLLSSVGSKILEDYIRNFDYEESIIGLDFVTEYHYRGKDEPYYYCELCTCELPLQCVLAHIFGLKHKMRYVRKRHPEILKLNVGKYKTIVKKKAIEIEKTDGRGRVRVIRDYNGPALSEKIAGGAMSFEDDDVESELPLVGYSFEQDQNTNMETTTSLDTRTKRSTTSSKPSNRLSCSKAGSRSDYKYSRRDSSTSRHVQSRKRESSKDTKHSGEDWRDEWQRSVKRTKYYKQDKERVKEKSIHSDRDKKRKSRSDSKDDYKKGDRSRSSKDDLHKGSSVSQRVSEKHGLSKQDIIKKEILAYLASFKVISDTDAGYVKEIMYKLSNRLLQFGQKAMKITGSAEKLIKETKSCIPDGNFGRDSHKTTNLGSYSGYSSRDKSMMESVEYSSSGSLTRSSSYHSAARNTDASIHNNLLSPSLLNSIRGMDECTITNTLTRLAANNPAFEGIRISTLVTVLMEAGVLSKRPK
ncbi:uncharacterized protein si:ch211-197h24.6 isoform X1 [Chiloscyllium plagiosum]|uniref:uncharacterized protein si:ch211-197h24.6 isoform X1 n=1 Tax=Chiloscyllium plagiosum TaxID=36176 RepID=UPI001CB87C91|nr:uncharacterized protein si:ch211-197h24.6 isoform X1 [Chiloscyllium plagiosum]XP_043545928.1 uncharacterized protein si:ch211-197h24.6 isoform X1 [Chiloscyllium plagiosum]